MGTIVYYNTNLTLPVGSADAHLDVAFDLVSGSVYEIKELDLLLSANPDTNAANSHHDVWISVAREGRTRWDPFAEGFDPDLLAFLVNSKAARPFGSFPLENSQEGYLADNPYFASSFRLGISTGGNVAGGNVELFARITAERVKQTQTIIDEMYRRANT